MSLLLGIGFLASSHATAQTDTVDVPGDIPPSIGHLNEAINAATASGSLSRTVFRLEPQGYYVLTGTITVPSGEHLTIVAHEPDGTQGPPQLVFSDTLDAGKVRFSFRCFGDITLRNLWLLYAWTDGQQMAVSLQIEDSPDSVKGQAGVFEGVIFDYAACPWNGSGAVGITAKHFRGVFKNCYFRNCVDPHFRYYGRALSFPFAGVGWHTDRAIFNNCTFANIGYVYEQEDGNYADYVQFNHCSFLNVVMYPLESGWWRKLAVTNSVFVNTHMMGYRPVEWPDREPEGGTIWIDSVARFGFNVPFTDQDRHILFANNSYFIEAWLERWMKENPMSTDLLVSGRANEVPVPRPMMNNRTIRFFDAVDTTGHKRFRLMNRVALYDSTDPDFLAPPSDTTAIKAFLYYKWFCCSDTNWAFAPHLSMQRHWPLVEDLAYANTTLQSAGMGGFPLGDLYHWWPQDYDRWKLQEGAEEERISQWLETGIDPMTVPVSGRGNGGPAAYVLDQNYPNPFNPGTIIHYQLSMDNYVSLRVYDLLGREAAVLVNERKPAGSYEVTFDAARLSSGVYIYRLIAGRYIESRKMVVLR